MVVLVEKADGVATVTMNRPEAMNALSVELRKTLAGTFAALAADDEVRAIVLTGAGGRAFTAGLDLKELASTPGARGAANPTSAADDPVLAMEACPKPIVGAVNGVAITGGFEVALACDVLIADTHARVGILPGWGLSAKLSRTVGLMRAKELSLTGNFLDAKTAYEWGLVNRVVEPDELLRTAQKLAHDMASIDPATSRTYKKLIDDGDKLTAAEARKLETATTKALNAAVTPDSIAERREQVQARGRSQG